MAKKRRHVTYAQSEEDSSFDSMFFQEGNRASTTPEKPIQRNAANARERARMRVLSKAFSRLKTSLPWVPPDTKLSKLDTLRLAATYIAHLSKILMEDNEQELQMAASDSKRVSSHPMTFTWPFTISSRPSYSDPPSSLENIDVPDPAQDLQTDYQSYASCEYMAISCSERPRREVLEHYF